MVCIGALLRPLGGSDDTSLCTWLSQWRFGNASKAEQVPSRIRLT